MKISFNKVVFLWAIKILDHVAGDQFEDVVVEMRVIDDGVRGLW